MSSIFAPDSSGNLDLYNSSSIISSASSLHLHGDTDYLMHSLSLQRPREEKHQFLAIYTSEVALKAEWQTEELFEPRAGDFKHLRCRLSFESLVVWEWQVVAPPPTFTLVYHRQDLNYTTPIRERKPRLWDHTHQTTYLLGLDFPNCQRVNSGLEVVYFTLFLLTRDDSVSELAHFFTQDSFAVDPFALPVLYDQESEALWRLVGEFLGKSQLDEVVALYLLAAVGFLDVREFPPKVEVATAQLLSLCAEDLEAVFNGGPEGPFKRQSVHGLACFMELNSVCGGEEWRKVLTAAKSGFRYYQELESDVIGREHLHRKLLECEFPVQSENLPALMENCKDLKSLILVLNSQSEWDHERIKVTLVTCLQDLTHAQVAALLDAVADSHPIVRVIYDTPEVYSHINKFLKSHRSLDTLPLIVRMVQTPSLSFLLQNFELERYVSSLVIDGELSFSEVALSLLRPLRRPLQPVFSLWVQGTVQALPLAKAISTADSELQRVGGHFGSELGGLAEAVVGIVCKKKDCMWTLNLADSFQAASTRQLRDAYVAHYLRKVSKRTQSGKMTIDSLQSAVLCVLQRMDQRVGGAEVLTQLALGLLQLVPKVGEKEVKEALITAPGAEESWRLECKHWQQLHSVPYVKSLLQSFAAFGNQLFSGQLTFADMSHIERQSELDRSHLCSFLSTAFLSQHVHTPSPSQLLAEAVGRAKSHLAEVRRVGRCIGFLKAQKLQVDSEEEAFKEFESRLGTVPIASFAVPQSLKELQSLSDMLGRLVESGVYAQFLEAERSRSVLSSARQLRLRDSLTVFTTALNHMKAEFSPVLERIDTLQLRSLLPFFLVVPSVDEEVDILSIVFPELREQLETARECVTAYRDQRLLVEACQTLLFLRDRRVFEDSEVEALCDSCIRTDVEKLQCRDYSERQRAIKRVLYGEFTKERGREVLSVLAEMKRFQPVLEFVDSLTPEQLTSLKEACHSFDSAYISPTSVLEVEALFTFLRSLRSSNYRGFLDSCGSLLSQPAHSNVTERLRNCGEHYKHFRSIIARETRGTSSQVRQIRAILQQAQVEVRFVQGAEVSVEAPPSEPFSLETIEEMKDRAEMMRQTGIGLLEAADYATFLRFVSCLRDIRKSVCRLIAFGTPSDDRVSLHCAFLNSDFSEVEGCQAQLRGRLEAWESALHTAYSATYSLTFFHGQQLWALENYLLQRNDTHRRECEHLLQYAEMTMSSSSVQYTAEGRADSPEHRLEALGRFLREYARKTVKPQPPLSYVVPAGAKVDPVRGAVLYCETRRPLQALLAVYLNSYGKPPSAHQVLWCRKETVWGELMAFLYRCFLCTEKEAVFTLLAPERLSVELQSDFQRLFARLWRMRLGGLQFSLAVVTCSEHCVVSSFFKASESPQVTCLRDSQMDLPQSVMTSIVQQLDPSTTVVRSHSAGDGKTLWVRSRAQQLQRKLLEVSLSGDIDLASLCQRIREHMTEATVLLLKVAMASEWEVVGEVVAGLSLFRAIVCGEAVVCFRYCLIYIELANMQTPLEDCVPYLRLLRCQEVGFSEESIQESSELKFVTLYLHLFDRRQIDSIDIASVSYSRSSMLAMVKKYFIAPQQSRQQPVTYRTLEIFLRALSTLLNNMEAGTFTLQYLPSLQKELSAYNMTALAAECSRFRYHVVQGLLASVEEVNTMSVSTLSAVEQNRYQRTVTFESKNHFLALFLPDGSFVPVYRRSAEVPKFIAQLLFIQSGVERQARSWLPTFLQNWILAHQVNSRHTELLDYAALSDSQLKALICATFASFAHNQRAEGFDDYVMTTDNFVKMMLVYMRAMARLPVVIMGETGCGKTYLIRYFVECVLRTELKVVNIHAGVTSSMIRYLLEDIVKLAAEVSPRQLWVFFDEFNTTSSVSQLTEVLCERKLESTQVPDNVVLLAACNPYRRKPKALGENDIGIQRKRRQAPTLVHLVNPLPHSIVDYVWDFGGLSDSDLRQYISAMLQQLDVSESLLATIKQMLYITHSHFRSIDHSIVSLRDVSRFLTLFKWFEKSLKARMKRADGHHYKQFFAMRSEELPWKQGLQRTETAVALALYYSYVLRVPHMKKRDELLELVTKVERPFTAEAVRRAVQQNEMDWLARMQLPQGLACNFALRENVATVVQCLFAQVPVFICGKPGCSKSLSVQTVLRSCQGPQSLDAYFRVLPALQPLFFQGSESCTSEAVQEVFDRALAVKMSGCGVPVVVFEEIGMAELSPHNPLKVLHSMLELENKDVAFVALSNWKLDASKMSRVMYLARPDPSESDLQQTALSLYSAGGGRPDAEQVVTALAKAYILFKAQSDEEFFGLRDFYQLMKMVARDGRDCSDWSARNRVVVNAVYRNFGGQEQAQVRFLQLYFRSAMPSYSAPLPLSLITANLSDPEARNLLLIAEGESGLYLLEMFLAKQMKRCRVFMGSQLPDDQSDEEYARTSLKHVLLCMEQGVPAVFKSMPQIYSGLYDLFNQNFTWVGNRRYCNVTLGAHFAPQRVVHEEFKAVVIMDAKEQAAQEIDPPFLSRFEKHRLSLQSLLTPVQTTTVQKLQTWLSALFSLSGNLRVAVDQRVVFPLLSNDYLALLALQKGEELLCKEEMMRTAAADVLILSSVSSLSDLSKDFVSSEYAKGSSASLSSLLLSHVRSLPPIPNLVIFTRDNEPLHSDLVPEVSVCVRHFPAFRSEKELTHDLESFFHSSPATLYIVDIAVSTHGAHLNWLKHVLEKVAGEYGDRSKAVCILVRLERCAKYSQSALWFQGWTTAACDSLAPSSLHVAGLIDCSVAALAGDESLFSFEKEFLRMLQDAYRRIETRSLVADFSEKLTERRLHLLQNAGKSEEFQSLMKRKTLGLMQNWPAKDWKKVIFADSECVALSSTLKGAISYAIRAEVTSVLTSVLFALEKVQALDSFFAEDSLLREIWVECFEGLDAVENIQPLALQNAVSVEYLLKFPFAAVEIRQLTYLYPQAESSNSSDSMDSYSSLLRSFRRGSLYRKFLPRLSSNQAHFQLFLTDLITVEFEGDVEDAAIRGIALQLHLLATTHIRDFETKAICYFRHQQVVKTICDVFWILHDLVDDEVLESVLDSLRQMRSVEDSERVSPLHFPQETATQVAALIEHYILQTLPNRSTFEQSKGMESYALATSELLSRLKSAVNNFGLSIKRLEVVELWSLIANFACETRISEESVLALAEQSQAYSHDFVYDRSFRDAVFSFFSSAAGNLKSGGNRYRTAFFRILLHGAPDAIGEIAREVESTEDTSFQRSVEVLANMCELVPIDCALSNVLSGSSLSSDDSSLPFLIELESALSVLGATSKLGVLLSDFFLRELAAGRSPDDEKSYSAEEFQQLQQALAATHPHTPNVAVLVVLAGMRLYLDYYALAIHCNAPSQSVVPAIDEYLKQDSEEVVNTLKLYCAKRWRRLGHRTVRELRALLDTVHTDHWPVAFVVDEHSAPLGLANSTLYQTCYHQLRKMLTYGASPDQLMTEIQAIDTPAQRVEFAVAWLAQVSTAHASGSAAVNLDGWLQAASDLLRSKLGPTLFTLVAMIKTNFPKESPLHISHIMTKSQYSLAYSLLLFLIVLLAHSELRSPMTLLFFNTAGSVHPDIVSVLSQLYVYGAESQPLYCELRYILDNFETVKSDAWRAWKEPRVKGSAYKCSNTCDYVYFVANCGAPMKKNECPYCKSQIGGVNHLPVKRPGHENLSDSEAKRFISSAISRYLLSEPRGYKHFASQHRVPVRNVSSHCYFVMHFWLNATFHFLQVAKLVEETSIRTAMGLEGSVGNLNQYFARVLESDVDALELPKAEDRWKWLEAITSLLPGVLEQEMSSSFLAARNDFEVYLDSHLILPNLSNPERTVSTYLSRCISPDHSYLPLIEETSPVPDSYPFYQLFRCVTEATVDHFTRSYKVKRSGMRCCVIETFTQSSVGFAQLECLFPLVKLTNYLMKRFNHIVARDEAKAMKMAEVVVGDATAKDLLEDFLAAWNRAPPFTLVYGCKELHFRQFSEDDELFYFLPDNKELGGGLYSTAAILTLSSLQNHLLSQCWPDFAKGEPVPAQAIHYCDVLSLPVADSLRRFAMSNLTYGRGMEVIYDFEAIESEWKVMASNAKRLNSEEIALVQYQFELQNVEGKFSSVIAEVRRKVRQEEGNTEIEQHITTSLLDLKQQNPSNFPTELRRLHSSLDYILCCLVPHSSQSSLSELCSLLDTSKLHSLLVADSDLAELPLRHLVVLYETVEQVHFPYLRDFVRTEFQQPVPPHLLQRVVPALHTWCASDGKLPLSTVKNALLRLISRCLTGYVSSSLTIEMYIVRSDFWPESAAENTIAEAAAILRGVELAAAVKLLEALENPRLSSSH